MVKSATMKMTITFLAVVCVSCLFTVHLRANDLSSRIASGESTYVLTKVINMRNVGHRMEGLLRVIADPSDSYYYVNNSSKRSLQVYSETGSLIDSIETKRGPIPMYFVDKNHNIYLGSINYSGKEIYTFDTAAQKLKFLRTEENDIGTVFAVDDSGKIYAKDRSAIRVMDSLGNEEVFFDCDVGFYEAWVFDEFIYTFHGSHIDCYSQFGIKKSTVDLERLRSLLEQDVTSTPRSGRADLGKPFVGRSYWFGRLQMIRPDLIAVAGEDQVVISIVQDGQVRIVQRISKQPELEMDFGGKIAILPDRSDNLHLAVCWREEGIVVYRYTPSHLVSEYGYQITRLNYRPVWLGIHGQQISHDIAEKFNLTSDYGILISGLEAHSPAAEKDNEIRVGRRKIRYRGTEYIVDSDILTKIEGRKVLSQEDIDPILATKKVGDIIELSLISADDQQKQVSVYLEASPERR